MEPGQEATAVTVPSEFGSVREARRSPVRVTHVITGLEVGGAEMLLSRVLARHDAAILDHEVVSMIEPGQVAGELHRAGIPVHTLGMRRSQPAPGAMLRLIGHLRQRRPHVVQTWLYHADVLGLLAAKVVRVPRTVWNLRGQPERAALPRLSQRAVLSCAAWLSRLPDAVIVNSRSGLESHVAAGYAPRRWALIPNGVDAALFRPNVQERLDVREELGLGGSEVVLGMVARNDPVKGHDVLLRALPTLTKLVPNLRLALIGLRREELSSELNAYLADTQLASHVSFLGRRADVPRLLNGLDLFVLPSRSEGFPNVLLEALASGLPCVASDVGDAADIVGADGFVVPPGDPAALAEGCLQLLRLTPEERRQIGVRARHRIVRDYGIEAVADTYASFYMKLSAGLF